MRKFRMAGKSTKHFTRFNPIDISEVHINHRHVIWTKGKQRKDGLLEVVPYKFLRKVTDHFKSFAERILAHQVWNFHQFKSCPSEID